jgi:hypothetical protein
MATESDVSLRYQCLCRVLDDGWMYVVLCVACG